MKNIKYDFKNKKAVITGGAQGLGLEMAKEFLHSGAQVLIWDFSQEAIESAKKELASFADQIKFHSVDVVQRVSCEEAVRQWAGPIDILVNNAGITRDKSFSKMGQNDFEAVINTNLTGVFNVTQAWIEKFNTTHRRIINISSVVGIYGNFGQTNYAAAKAGVIGMTKTWAKELGRKGFTVNALAPGFIQTRMVDRIPEDIFQSMKEKIPVSRLGLPHDIASACLFLASEEASYINGAVLSVDGGLVL